MWDLLTTTQLLKKISLQLTTGFQPTTHQVLTE